MQQQKFRSKCFWDLNNVLITCLVFPLLSFKDSIISLFPFIREHSTFIHKLVPYKSLFNKDENTITAWWGLIIALIFLSSLVRFFSITNELKKTLLKNFSEERVQDDKYLQKAWRKYSDSFVDYEGEKMTNEESILYFNKKLLLQSKLGFRVIQAIPSTLVGLGILGTFFGLTYGISDFNTTNVDEVKKGIEVLLSGMGTAFVTSIYGMSTSLIFTIIEKWRMDSLQNSISKFCFELDRKYKFTKEHERKYEFNAQGKLMKEYLLYIDDDGNEVKFSNVLRDLYSESEKQTAALKSFSTDLARSIQAGFEKILNDPDEGVVHELRNLKEELNRLGDKIQNPATDMIENVVGELESVLTEVIEEFRNSVSGSTKLEFENLAQLLNQAGTSLDEFPDRLEQMTHYLNDDFRELQDVIKTASIQTSTQAEQSMKRMRVEIDKMSEEFEKRMTNLQRGQEELINVHNETMKTSENLLVSFNASIDRLNNLTSDVDKTVGGFVQVQEGIKHASEYFNKIAGNVAHSTENFGDIQLKFSAYLDEFLEENKQTIIEIQSSFLAAEKLSSEYSEKFKIIESGLQGIFQEIEDGLKQYKDVVNESLTSFLDKYSNANTKAAQSLEGSITSLDEILEEFLEEMNKTPNIRHLE